MNPFLQRLFLALALCSLLGLTIACGGGLGEAAPAFRYLSAIATTSSGEAKSTCAVPDGTGGQWVAGSFTGTLSISDTVNATSEGGLDIFAIHYTNTGAANLLAVAGGTADAHVRDICPNGAGGIWITGYFNGTLQVGATAYVASGAGDIFVANILSDGSWDSVVIVGGSSSSNEAESSWGICADGSGGCWVAGHFVTTLVFGSTTLTSAGDTDIFVAHLANDSTWVAAVSGGSTSSDSGVSVTPDGYGGCWVAGYFSGISTFGSTTIVADHQMYSGLTQDIFIGRISNSGNWSGTYSPIGSFKLTVDHKSLCIVGDGSNGVMLSGNYIGSAIFATNSLLSASGSGVFEGFVARMSSTGSWLFATRTVKAQSTRLSYGSGGTYWVTGKYEGAAWFDNMYFYSDTPELYLASINTTGYWQTALTTRGLDGGLPTGLVWDGDDGPWVTGWFTGTVTFSETDLTSTGTGADIFVAGTGIED